MKLAVASLLLSAATLTAAVAAADDPKAPEGDLAKFQGKWSATLKTPDAEIPLVIEFKDRDIVVNFTDPDGGEVTMEGKIKLDEKANPKQIDFVELTSPNGGTSPDNLGIYEFHDDEVKIRTGGPDNPRPDTFDDSGNPDSHQITLKRIKG
jgi:uncharacterized protein (TIGR03067 family)